MLKNSLFITEWQKDCIEEMVILDGTRDLLNYSLSNSLDTIETAIYSKTGHKIDLKISSWKLNPELSISVKHLMNYHNVNYSMTTDIKDEVKYLVVNMRVGDNWYITGYDEINGKFINWELIRTYLKATRIAARMINDYYSDTDEE
jgi:hypothetical protein